MKNFLIVLCLGLASCLSSKARDEGLLPAAHLAWPGVRADIELGIQTVLDHGTIVSVPVLQGYIITIDAGLKTGDRNTLARASWESLEPYGYHGIDERIRTNQISPMIADSLRERLRNFGWAMAKLQQLYVRLEPSPTPEYWLPRVGVRSTPEAFVAAKDHSHAQ